MQKMRTILGALLVFTLFVVGRTEAASVQYMLDQSNALEDNIDYLLVTISDNQPGQLDFLVETRSALSGIAGGNFGIASFGFNFDSGNEAYKDNFLLPENWRVQFNKGMSEAGKFDVRIMGTGQARQDPLQFSVLGMSLEDFIPGFASHVAGFDMEYGGYEREHDGYDRGHRGYDREHRGYDRKHGDHVREHRDFEREYREFEGKHNISSAFFYGDRPVTSEVPVPAAFWLFGSGMLLLGRVATRRRS